MKARAQFIAAATVLFFTELVSSGGDFQAAVGDRQ